eukprot:m.151150 g.151150  ORF g.151150 m.151150 type:complete len:956 (+) comp13291_c3_seq1:335-3202(+)
MLFIFCVSVTNPMGVNGHVSSVLVLVLVLMLGCLLSSPTSAQSTTSAADTTVGGVVCSLMDSQISVSFPVVHNCSSVSGGQHCVVHCDASQGFYGDPVVIDCTLEGNIIPYGAVQCVENVNTLETDERGIHLRSFQGDVYAIVGDKEIGISTLDSAVIAIDGRLDIVENFDLDSRVDDIESADLSGSITSLSTEVSQEQSTSFLTLSTAIRDATTGASMATASVAAKLNGVQATTSSSILSLLDDVDDADSSLENELAAFSSEVSSSFSGAVSNFNVLADHISDVDDNASVNSESIEGLTDKMDVVEGLTAALNFTGQSKDNPGLTCSHILIEQKGSNSFGDGMYWIDPNGGSNDDAFQAYCDMTNGGYTRVDPRGNVPVAHHKPSGVGDARSWYGKAFTYDFSTSQLQALIHHSTEATQDAEFTCKGVIVHTLDDAIYGGAAFFRGFLSTGEIWSVNGNGIEYEALKDNCGQNDASVTEKAEFRFETRKPENLPIVDINILDDGDSVEEWGLVYKAAYFRYVVRDGSSPKHSGLTCSHIKRDFPNVKNGYYFIDPNRGDFSDAVKVFCDMERGWTHFQPTANIPQKNYHTGSDGYQWTSSFGVNIGWEGSDQLEAIQALSTNARQDITFHCKGVIAYSYYPVNTRTHLHVSLFFRTVAGSSSSIYWSAPTKSPQSSGGTPNYIYNVKNDGCRINDGVWRTTDFLFETGNAFALPIRDISIQDIGGSGEHFGADFSPVQFKTTFGAPLGSTRDTAPQTCKDIYHSDPNAKSGYYFIDPNGGSTDDAVYVECDMEKGGWTGIHPQREVPFNNWWTSGDGYRWFRDMTGGFEMPYDINDAQLQALQDASVGGYQVIKLNCQGVITWYEGSSLYSGRAEFAGGIGRETWTATSSPDRQPIVNFADDSCRDNSEAHIGRVIFYFDTGNPSGFPIRDIRLSDHGDGGELFGLDVSTCWFY